MTALSDQPASAAPPTATKARDNLVILILLISTFVVILNETIMNVALAPLMDSLNVSASAVQWLTTAFLLTMAIIIPVTGFLIQRVNTKPLFILAMSLFSIGTLTAALAPGLEILIVARIIQASGTAIMMPLLMTTLMTLVPPAGRGKMMGNISIVISVAPAIGPALSGIILAYLDWRWLFLLILPIAVTTLIIGARLISNVTTPRYAPLDILSVIISALAFGGIVYGLSSFGAPSETANMIPGWIPLSIGAVTMVIFVLRQITLQKQNRPLLDLRTFASKNYSISVAMMGIAMMVLFGTIILLPIYMQNVLGLSTLKTGLILLPGGLIMGLLAPFVGRLYDKYGPTPWLISGATIVSAVLWMMTLLHPGTPFSYVLIGHMTISVGLALIFTPLFTVSLSSVKPELYSHGSAILGSVQQVFGAAGVALFIAIMSAQTALRIEAGIPEKLALSGAITTAFTVGASLSLLAILAAFFIRKAPIYGADETH